MVKRIMAMGFSGAVLLLSSCELLNLAFSSVFPVTATQTVAQYDLSAEIPLEKAKEFRLTELLVGGTRIYVLCSDSNQGGIGLFVFNENLVIIRTMDLDYLRSICGSFSGTHAMVDDFGTIGIGNLRFSFEPPETFSVLWPPKSPIPTPLNNPGFSASNENIVDIRLDDTGNNLLFRILGTEWLNSGAYPYDRTVPIGGYYSYDSVSVFYDRESGGDVILALRRNDSEAFKIVKIPASDFLSTGILLSPLSGNYPNMYVSGSASDLFGYSRYNMVRYQYDVGNFIRFDIDAADNSEILLGTFHDWNAPRDVSAVYAMAGDFYYVFDRKTRILTKLVTWWPK
jgi:hypothetical protein